MTETSKTDVVDPRAALDAAIDAARLAKPFVHTEDGRRRVFVPDGYRLEDITDPELLPKHIARTVRVDERASLVDYANRFGDFRSILMADYDAGTITAHLDWHSPGEDGPSPQPVCHAAVLKLRNSEEFARWNDMEGELHSQDDFAQFVEENVADVIDPDHSVLLEICRDLEATQGVAFKSGTRLDNGDRSFRYETETHVRGEVQVPTEITLSIPLYYGEEPHEVRAKFRFRPQPGGLRLGFRWHRVEYVRQALFREMAFAAAEATGLPVYFGR